MSETPQSETPGLRPMVAPFQELLERLAEAGFTVEPGPEAEGEVFVRHADFERQRDAEGNPRYQSPTDCEGSLRIADQSAAIWQLCCDACGFEVGVAMERVDPERLLGLRLERAGLPDGFVGKAFEGGDEQQERTLRTFRLWIREFNPHKLGLSLPAPGLWGAAGRGKTHLLALTIETLIKRYRADAMYRSAQTLMDELQAGLDSAAYEIRWQRALRVKVLALDDLGADRLTEWRQDRLAALVDYRYSHELPLLIATNIPPARWPETFGERTASRLRGMVVPVKLEGVDRRAQGVQQQLGAAA